MVVPHEDICYIKGIYDALSLLVSYDFDLGNTSCRSFVTPCSYPSYYFGSRPTPLT